MKIFNHIASNMVYSIKFWHKSQRKYICTADQGFPDTELEIEVLAAAQYLHSHVFFLTQLRNDSSKMSQNTSFALCSAQWDTSCHISMAILLVLATVNAVLV